MRHTLVRSSLVGLLLCLTASNSSGEENVYDRAFPKTIPPDASFETVANHELAYSKLRYPVPIIGWKHHPEEMHVTPEGALVLPGPRKPSLYITPLIAMGGHQPAMLSPEAVSTTPVDGYMPGFQNVWEHDGIIIQQTVFGSLLAGDEVVTGREVLLGVMRFELRNHTDAERKGEFHLNFGEAQSGHPHKRVPPGYPAPLVFNGKSLLETDGKLALKILDYSFKRPVFARRLAAEDQAKTRLLNGNEETIARPEFELEVTRKGDVVEVGDWKSTRGMDLHYEASARHSSPGVVEVEIAAPGGDLKRVGFLSMNGYSGEMPPVSFFVSPGQHTPALGWSQLKRHLPEGASKLSLRPYHPTPSGPQVSRAWEPRFYLTSSGGSPVFKGAGDPSQNTLRFPFRLAAGQTGKIDVVIPYFALPAEQAGSLEGSTFEEHMARFRRFWEQELNKNAEFIIPEPRLRNAYRMWLANNLMLVDRDPKSGLLLIHPDPTAYEMVWAGDASVVMHSMDRMGYQKEVREYADYFFARQGKRKPDGDVDASDGFFTGDAAGLAWLSENGFVLWALSQHYKLTGDKGWLKEHAAALESSAEWIVRQRERTKQMDNGEKPASWGLMVKGRPSDLGDWDHWYFIDTYSYMGLRNGADVLGEAGLSEVSSRLGTAADDYKKCILDSLQRSINRKVDPPFVPLTPSKNANPTAEYLYRYWYSLNPPIYMVEAGLFDAKDEKASWSNYWVEKLGMVSGLCKLVPETVDGHYVYHQALSYLLRGETDKFIWSLYSLYAYGQSRESFATVEWSNLRTGIKDAECWDDYRQPHMHSNSRCLAMLRIALLLEDRGKLHLMMGTPRGWLADGKTIEVRKAPSEFGGLSYAARSQIEQGRITLTIQPPDRMKTDLVVHVRPPQKYGPIRSVTVNGQRWTSFTEDALNLGPIEGPTEVVCFFK